MTALQIARDTLGNQQLAAVVSQACDGVRAGQRLAQPLHATGRFPVLAIQMIQVGEETGQLDAIVITSYSIHYTKLYDQWGWQQ